MNRNTMKILDKGLCALESHTTMKNSGEGKAFQHLSITLLDIRELRASLKNPDQIDIKKWSKLFTSLQQRSLQLGESGKISKSLLLTALMNYKKDAIRRSRQTASYSG